MKKTFLALSIIGISVMTSCKKEESKATTTDIIEATFSEAKIENETNISIPKFSTKEIQQFADDYASYITAIIQAKKYENLTELTKLEAQTADWNKKITEAATSLSAEDAIKWATFAQDLAKAKEK